MSSSCKCKDCGFNSSSNDLVYLYRNLKGVSTFTGFGRRGEEIIWLGKDEKQFRKIDTTKQEDINFFMGHMKQYD